MAASLPSTNALITGLRKLTATELARLDDRQLAKIDWLLREAKYDHLDSLCSLAEVSEAGQARDKSGPLLWLQNYTMSVDDHALAKGTPPRAPFPRKTYFTWLFGALLYAVVHPSDICQSVFIPKSRDMMCSLSICGYLTWLAQWRSDTFSIVQTAKQEKALELIRYCRVFWENQEPWLQERHPLAYSTAAEIGWTNGSRILAVPSGMDQVRLHHPFCYVQDESAFLPDCQQCFDAVVPVARQAICVSTAAPGWFADECSAEGGHAPLSLAFTKKQGVTDNAM